VSDLVFIGKIFKLFVEHLMLNAKFVYYFFISLEVGVKYKAKGHRNDLSIDFSVHLLDDDERLLG
jgi:hypothetical protein